MKTKTVNETSVVNKAWTAETTNFFVIRLDGIAAVLDVLISNIDEYTKGDGRAEDEAMVLVNQQLLAECREVERVSYEFMASNKVDTGDLSLYIMWTRSLLEITDGMFQTDSWEVKLSDRTLVGYFGLAKRHVDRAFQEVSKIGRGGEK